MTAQTKQEELNSKVEVIKRWSLGRFHDNHDDGDLAINDAINGMKELINSEVLSALGEVEETLKNDVDGINRVETDYARGFTSSTSTAVATIQSIKNRYKL